MIAVGAISHDGVTTDGGAVYVFEQAETDQWSQVAKLLPSPLQWFHFGRDLSVSGDTLIAGHPGEPDNGKVFVFKRYQGLWSLMDTLETVGVGGFGKEIVLYDDELLIGASFNLNGLANVG